MTEFVTIPVPADRVLEVYALLASEPTRQPAEPGPELDAAEPPDRSSWSDELIARCWRESPSPMKAFLLYLAKHPDREISSEEIAPAIERTRQQMSGMLGAFGRRTKNRYGMGTCPYSARWGFEEHRAIYVMDSQTAEVIRKVASDA
jgi:hypothetical protein